MTTTTNETDYLSTCALLEGLSKEEIADLLHAALYGDGRPQSCDQVRAVIVVSKRKGIEVPLFGTINYVVIDAAVEVADSKLRCDLVEHQWEHITPAQRDYLVEYGNSSVRQLIAEKHSPDLTHTQLRQLLNDPELAIVEAAAKHGLTAEMHDRFNSWSQSPEGYMQIRDFISNLRDSDLAAVRIQPATNVAALDPR